MRNMMQQSMLNRHPEQEEESTYVNTEGLSAWMRDAELRRVRGPIDNLVERQAQELQLQQEADNAELMQRQFAQDLEHASGQEDVEQGDGAGSIANPLPGANSQGDHSQQMDSFNFLQLQQLGQGQGDYYLQRYLNRVDDDSQEELDDDLQRRQDIEVQLRNLMEQDTVRIDPVSKTSSWI